MATVWTITNLTQTSFTANWTSQASSAEYYSIELWRPSEGGTLVASSYLMPANTRSYPFSGLTTDTQYQVKLYSRNASGTTFGPDYISVRTLSPPAPAQPTNFRVYDKPNNTTLSLAWNTVSGATHYVVEVYRVSTGALVWYNYNISGGSVHVSGLVNGVSYNLKLYAVNAGGNSTPTWLYSVVAGYVRPNDWEWSITKAKGRSYTISNGRFTNLVSYNEITSFRSRINEFRLYKELDVYTFASMPQGAVFTATMYNSLAASISEMNPPTKPLSTGSVDVLLNRLRDSLNSIT